ALWRAPILALLRCRARCRASLGSRERSGPGRQLGDQLDSLAPQLVGEKGHAGEVAAWTGETGDQAFLDRVSSGDEDDRDRRRRFLRLVPKSCRLGLR